MHPILIPTLNYRKPKEAMVFLEKAFGFKRGLIHEDNNGIIVHAQITYKNAMIMLSEAYTSEYHKLIKVPNDLEGLNTQSPFIIIPEEELEAHYQKAKINGAEIVIELVEEPHGKGYTCKDPEGHLWNFGTYNPFI